MKRSWVALFRDRLKRKPRFISHLPEFLERAGLRPEDLAEGCRVSPETIRLIMAGTYEPSVVLAQRIAVLLDCPVEALFTVLPPPEWKEAPNDERLEAASKSIGFGLSMAVTFGSLLASNIFLLLDYEVAAYSFGALWAVAAVSYLVAQFRIPGFLSFSRGKNRRGLSKWQRIRSAIYRGIFFGTVMMFFGTHRTITGRLLTFLIDGLLYGFLIYWWDFWQGRTKTPN